LNPQAAKVSPNISPAGGDFFTIFSVMIAAFQCVSAAAGPPAPAGFTASAPDQTASFQLPPSAATFFIPFFYPPELTKNLHEQLNTLIF